MKELYSFVQWARLCLRTNNEDDVMKIFSFLVKMSVDLVQMKNTISQSEESEIILSTFISEFTFSIRKEFLKSKNDFSTGAYSKCFQAIMKSILSNPESLNEAQDGFKLTKNHITYEPLQLDRSKFTRAIGISYVYKHVLDELISYKSGCDLQNVEFTVIKI